MSDFEKDEKQSVIISVRKINYGYDNSDIDFICLADPKQSDIDIRQIIGRGIRWDKIDYPDKILHVLIPLYKDEFDTFKSNTHLKRYLDFIIGECGQDIIIDKDGKVVIGGNSTKSTTSKYDGYDIPIELLHEYSTTGYNRYSEFMRFLKNNKIYNEISYNQLREQNEHVKWMVSLDRIKEKYPKFCFRTIHPKANEYY